MDAMRGKKKGKGASGVRVLAGGVFNIVHPGHVHFLKKAKELGEELVVVVASDRTVLRRGKRLLFPAAIRAETVRALRFVDKAVIGDDEDFSKVVRQQKPDVIAIGYDQDEAPVRELLQRPGLCTGCRVVRIGLLKGYSTKDITGG